MARAVQADTSGGKSPQLIITRRNTSEGEQRALSKKAKQLEEALKKSKELLQAANKRNNTRVPRLTDRSGSSADMAQIKSTLNTVLNVVSSTAKKSDIAKLKEVTNLGIPSNTGTGKAASSASVPAEYHEFLKEEIKCNHEREKERRDFAEKSASAASAQCLEQLERRTV